jgi:hypothetical protein
VSARLQAMARAVDARIPPADGGTEPGRV